LGSLGDFDLERGDERWEVVAVLHHVVAFELLTVTILQSGDVVPQVEVLNVSLIQSMSL